MTSMEIEESVVMVFQPKTKEELIKALDEYFGYIADTGSACFFR